MTSVVRESVPHVEKVAHPHPHSVAVGLIAGPGVQIDVLLDAQAPVSVMIDGLVKLVDSRLVDIGETSLDSDGPGRWALCRVDGTPLRAAPSLTDQDIFDGDRIWLRLIPDTERRAQVIESVSTAAAAGLTRRFGRVDGNFALRVGTAMLAAGVGASATMLGWWRWQHGGWLPSVYGAVIAAAVLAVAVALLVRAGGDHDRRIADLLLLSSLAPLTVAAAAAPPGPVGPPGAALGLGVLCVASALALRFTGRLLGVYTALTTICVVATVASVARMTVLTGTVTLLASVVMVCVLGYQGAPALARRLAGIRLPIFPSANSRWVFETRPELPSIVRSDSGTMTLEGPASVSELLLKVERARSFLTGLLVGLGVLIIGALAGLTDAHSELRWTAVALTAFSAGFLLLRGRSYIDRWQAVILAGTAVLIVTAVVVRYALISQSVIAVTVAAAILVVLPAAGLIAAAVVPNSIYSPLFRTVVEWIEYVCLLPIFPLALWLMNAYAAIRYR